jgi:hypothetical protein
MAFALGLEYCAFSGLIFVEYAMFASVSALLAAVQSGKANFDDVLNHINAHYEFTPTTFNNGAVNNPAGQNSGSCRVLAFAQLHHLNPLDTLSLFAEHYKAVAANPAGEDHQNIRQFKKYGWGGVQFKGQPLKTKVVVTEKPIDQKSI